MSDLNDLVRRTQRAATRVAKAQGMGVDHVLRYMEMVEDDSVSPEDLVEAMERDAQADESALN